MQTQFLNDIEDIGWLLSTHLRKKNVACFNSFLLYGNEDCPEKIELFKKLNPSIKSKPFATFVIDKNGDLQQSA